MFVNSRLEVVVALAATLVGVFASFAGPYDGKSPDLLAGRASSVPNEPANSFRMPAGDLPFSEIVLFRAGKSLFEVDLARALGETERNSAVGGGATTCSDCHAGGARGDVRQQGWQDLPALPLVAFQGEEPFQSKRGEVSDSYRQSPATLVWEEVEASIDGQSFRLVSPAIFFGKERAEGVHLRVAPPQVGLALIELIEDNDILAWFEANGRGRVPWVQEADSLETQSVGRFGLKAQHRTVLSFVAVALQTELGLQAETLGERRLRLLALYSGEIGVPARTASRDTVGEQHFNSFGCQSCHRPQYEIFRTINGKGAPLDIWPFSDFLLHDLGYGEFSPAADSWWRTTPLWGLGRVTATSESPAYLHDGRARSLREAILWHGGEARAERSQFLAASPSVQQELLEFLESL